MDTKQPVHSDLAIPPCEYLEEVLVELGMSREELAKRLDLAGAELGRILRGDEPVTPALALQLEKILGVPTHIWTGLEEEYHAAITQGHGQC